MKSFPFLLTFILSASPFIEAAAHNSDSEEEFATETCTNVLQAVRFLSAHHIVQGGWQFTSGTPVLFTGKFKDTHELRASDDELLVHQPRSAQQIVAAFDAGRAIIKDSREHPGKYLDVGMVYLRAFFTALDYTVNTPDAQPAPHTPTSTAGTAATARASAPRQTTTSARQGAASTPEELLRAGMRKFCGNSEPQRAASSAPAKKELASEKQLRAGMQKFFGAHSSKK